MRKSIQQKMAEANGRQPCGPDCPLFEIHCFNAPHNEVCQAKFKEGYLKGYRQAQKDIKAKKPTT